MLARTSEVGISGSGGGIRTHYVINEAWTPLVETQKIIAGNLVHLSVVHNHQVV